MLSSARRAYLIFCPKFRKPKNKALKYQAPPNYFSNLRTNELRTSLASQEQRGREQLQRFFIKHLKRPAIKFSSRGISENQRLIFFRNSKRILLLFWSFRASSFKI